MDRRYLILRVSDNFFALELRHAKEIIPHAPATPLPSMPAFLEGLIHLRGFFLPLVNLEVLLNTATSRGTSGGKIIIVSLRKKIMGIHVDDVEDIIAVQESDILPSPALLSSMESNYLDGGFCIDGKSILIIAIEKLFAEKVIRTHLKRMDQHS